MKCFYYLEIRKNIENYKQMILDLYTNRMIIFEISSEYSIAKLTIND